MQPKIIKLIIALFVFFPAYSFGQTTESAHPKMDKYYPRPPEEKPIANPVTAQPVMTNTPSVTNNNTVQPNTVVAPKPVEQPAPSPMETPPAVTSTPVTVETPKMGVTDTTSINQPAAVTQTLPVQKAALPVSPPNEVYMDTRLGSSSPQYDTWKKNNDGAGSVTTHSK